MYCRLTTTITTATTTTTTTNSTPSTTVTTKGDQCDSGRWSAGPAGQHFRRRIFTNIPAANRQVVYYTEQCMYTVLTISYCIYL